MIKFYLVFMLSPMTTVAAMLVLIFSLLLPAISLSVSSKPGQFRAAVYEHELVLPTSCSSRVCSREEAINLMEVNLKVLEEQVVEAAKQEANIILLPEDGIEDPLMFQ